MYKVLCPNCFLILESEEFFALKQHPHIDINIECKLQLLRGEYLLQINPKIDMIEYLQN